MDLQDTGPLKREHFGIIVLRALFIVLGLL